MCLHAASCRNLERWEGWIETMVRGDISSYQCASGNSKAMATAYSECQRVARLSAEELCTDAAFQERRQRYGSLLRECLDRYSRKHPTVTMSKSAIVRRQTTVVDSRCDAGPAGIDPGMLLPLCEAGVDQPTPMPPAYDPPAPVEPWEAAVVQPTPMPPTYDPPAPVERTTPSTGGASVKQLDTTENVGGDDTASYGSGGLEIDDLLALGVGNAAGNPRAHAPGVVMDHNGVAIGEDDHIAGEVVTTAAEATRRAKQAMSQECLAAYNAGTLDLRGYNKEDKATAQAIATRHGHDLRAQDVFKVLRNARHRAKPTSRGGKTAETEHKAEAESGAQRDAGTEHTARTGSVVQTLLTLRDAGTTTEHTAETGATPSAAAATVPACPHSPRRGDADSTSREGVAGSADATPSAAVATVPACPHSPRKVDANASRDLIDDHMAPMNKVSPSKPGGSCDVQHNEGNKLLRAIDAHPDQPYTSLYKVPYQTRTDATVAATVVGLELSRPVRVQPKLTAETGASAAWIYGCACSGCTESLATDGLKPFQLVLHLKKDMYYFDKGRAQHRHGWRCAPAKPITKTAGHLPAVREYIQENPDVDNGVLMKFLVHRLKFDKPENVTLAEQGRVVLGNKWSQTMRRLKSVAWAAAYGPELNELAVWTRLFNESPQNGYAVMRLQRDDEVITYDGVTQEPPEGEFLSFSCVFKPTLMACMQAGVRAISADGTFLPIRSDLNMLVCVGECPSASTNGLTIVPVANHLCFGESTESYIDLWQFMVDYGDGAAKDWLSGITLHGDRGPGGCMASALEHVLPDAVFRSCAFHVWQALERNVPPTTRIDRTLFSALVNAPTAQTFRRLLSHIKQVCAKSYQYIQHSKPEQYCKGHPDFVMTFNTGVNNSLAEVEMNRQKDARKTGKSIMNLQRGVAAVVSSTCDKWLRQVRDRVNHDATPGDFPLMPRAEVMLRDSMQHMSSYYWLGEQALVDIMSKGGQAQLASIFKGAGVERATYTLRVKPGATCLADITCDCSLRLATEYKIACVHIAKLVHAVEGQITVHKHQLLAGRTWHASTCKDVFEKQLTQLVLPDCSRVASLVRDGVTVRDLAAKGPGRHSDKRLVSKNQPLTNSSRYATGGGRAATKPPAKTFGEADFALAKTCSHEPGSLDDIRQCAYCQAQRVNAMLDPALFQAGTLCELVYENEKGRTSKTQVLWSAPEKNYVGARKGQATGRKFLAFGLSAASAAGRALSYRFDRVKSIRVLDDDVASDTLQQLLNGTAARRRVAAKADKVKQKAAAEELKRASLAEKVARKEADQINIEVKRCLTEVMKRIEREARIEREVSTRLAILVTAVVKKVETAQRAAKREQEIAQRAAKREQETAQRAAKRAQETAQRAAKRAQETAQRAAKRAQEQQARLEEKEQAAKRAQEKQARLEDKARAQSARPKAKAEPVAKRRRKAKASRKRASPVSNDGELWRPYEPRKRR